MADIKFDYCSWYPDPSQTGNVIVEYSTSGTAPSIQVQLLVNGQVVQSSTQYSDAFASVTADPAQHQVMVSIVGANITQEPTRETAGLGLEGSDRIPIVKAEETGSGSAVALSGSRFQVSLKFTLTALAPGDAAVGTWSIFRDVRADVGLPLLIETAVGSFVTQGHGVYSFTFEGVLLQGQYIFVVEQPDLPRLSRPHVRFTI